MTATAGAIPVIDIAALRGGGETALRAIGAQIGAAARDTGFFAVLNHGIPAADLDAMFAAARTFFALPLEAKEATAIERSQFYRGYARIGFEKLDPTLAGDAKESFNIGPEFRADDPAVLAGTQGCNQWPELPGFRATLLRYFGACLALVVDLHRAIAHDLGTDPEYFTPHFKDAQCVLRILRYPPHPGRFDGTLYGAGPHTDYGNLTLLAQDDAGGLELQRRDGSWLAIPPIAGAFVCNIGDCLMRWSNDVYVSNLHRVVNTSGRERYSIAFFGDPNFNAEVACLPSCATEERPARYAPISYAQHLRMKYESTYVGTPA